MQTNSTTTLQTNSVPATERKALRPLGGVDAAAIAVAAFSCYLILGVIAYWRFQATGFDLGIFEQAVKAYASMSIPEASLKGPDFNLLGDHFSPVWIVAAPFYWLAPGAPTLIGIQAGALALSVFIVTRSAQRELSSRLLGNCLGFAYALSWGLLAAANFDVHEICFAAPLVALSLDAILRRAWRSAVIWALPLVLVREDMGLTVATIGACLFLYGQRRRGVALAIFGLASTVLTILVVIPQFSASGKYTYFEVGGQNSSARGLALSAVTDPSHWWFVFAALGITLFTALGSRIMVVALPVVAWRVLSNNPAYWGTAHHYSVTLMPIVFLAAIDALRQLNASSLLYSRTVVKAASAAICGLAVLLAIPTAVSATQLALKPCATCTHAETALTLVPDNVSVAATNHLAPHLTARADVFLLSPSTMDDERTAQRIEWIIADATETFPGPNGNWVQPFINAQLAYGDWTVEAQVGDITVLRRTGIKDPPIETRVRRA